VRLTPHARIIRSLSIRFTVVITSIDDVDDDHDDDDVDGKD